MREGRERGERKMGGEGEVRGQKGVNWKGRKGERGTPCPPPIYVHSERRKSKNCKK